MPQKSAIKKTKTPPKGYHGFPQPQQIKCSDCGNNLLVKFVISRQAYSQKNNWGYWTEKEANQLIYKCNACLRKIYAAKFTYWAAVKNPKKRSLFRTYLHEGSI